MEFSEVFKLRMVRLLPMLAMCVGYFVFMSVQMGGRSGMFLLPLGLFVNNPLVPLIFFGVTEFSEVKLLGQFNVTRNHIFWSGCLRLLAFAFLVAVGETVMALFDNHYGVIRIFDPYFQSQFMRSLGTFLMTFILVTLGGSLGILVAHLLRRFSTVAVIIGGFLVYGLLVALFFFVFVMTGISNSANFDRPFIPMLVMFLCVFPILGVSKICADSMDLTK